MDGYNTCEKLRGNQYTKHIPVLMLTGLDTVESRIRAFKNGADDFIAKPFNREELILRICAKLKRRSEPLMEDEQIYCGNLNIHFTKHETKINNKTVFLTSLEYKILYFILKNKEKVLNRDQFLNAIWKNTKVSARTIDTHISCLRKKLWIQKFVN